VIRNSSGTISSRDSLNQHQTGLDICNTCVLKFASDCCHSDVEPLWCCRSFSICEICTPVFANYASCPKLIHGCMCSLKNGFYKLSLKGAWSRHVTHFKFFVPPKISLERLKLETSNLVCMLIIASPSLRMTNCP